MRALHTIGHSTRPAEVFIGLLRTYGIVTLADVRSVPRSRHNPQFERDVLAAGLEALGIGYAHLPALGGMRRPRPDSVNLGLRSAGFRGYADHMQTDEFRRGLERLEALAGLAGGGGGRGGWPLGGGLRRGGPPGLARLRRRSRGSLGLARLRRRSRRPLDLTRLRRRRGGPLDGAGLVHRLTPRLARDV